jgi:hypothetical protein
LSLVDVGASGGIERHWEVFGRALRAWGFDPLIAEVARLNSITKHPAVSYHALRIIGGIKGPKGPRCDKLTEKDNHPLARTSAVHAISVLKMDYARRFFDPTGAGVMTDEESSLDDFFSKTPHAGIDFIKIDTDGADFDVLLGAEGLIRASPTLGIFIEVQFHGPVRSDANLFCNVDSFLRARGFSLFDIEVYRYSRATLPKAFACNIPAQTRDGQVVWGDALYLRDAGDPDYEDMWGIRLSTEKLLKLAAIHELYGLEDCAAEALCKYRGKVDEVVDVSHCLNLLTPPVRGRKVTFEEYRERFEREPRQWFPDAWAGRRLLETGRGLRDRLAPQGTRRRRLCNVAISFLRR